MTLLWDAAHGESQAAGEFQAADEVALRNGANEGGQDVAQDLVRVAIVDLSPQFGAKLAEFIGASQARFHVVLTATSWAELVGSESFPVRALFLDADADERVSVQARIRACRATGAVVVATTELSEATTDWQRTRAIVEDAGALGLVSKLAPFSDFTDFLDSVGLSPAGGATVPPELSQLSTPQLMPKLSIGETAALTLYSAGKTVAEVGVVMNVQYETAKTYIRRVREKYALLGRAASSRADLISRAREDGFLS
jgi:DNA-binding NarL/FixJ family response regulator